MRDHAEHWMHDHSGWGTGGDASSGSGDTTQQSDSTIHLSQSNETVSATSSGADNFVFNSLSQQGDVINNFVVGQDHLVINDHSVAPGDIASDLSLQPSTDGTSTDVVADVNGTTHTLATLEGVQVSDLSSVLQSPHLPVSVIQVSQSSESVSGTSGPDAFVINSLSQQNDTIDNFTVGQDHLSFGHGVDTSQLSLVQDGSSTDVVVGAGTSQSHTLVTLDGVQATDLQSLLHPTAAAGTAAATTTPATTTTADTSTATSTDTTTSPSTTTVSDTTTASGTTASDTATTTDASTTATTEGSGSSTGTSIDVNQSNETVYHTTDTGSDTFNFDALSQSNDVVNGFTPGVDHLDFHDASASGSALLSQLSFEPTPDGSTDVVVGADTSSPHVLLTLENVSPSSLHAGTDYFAS